MIAAVLLVVTLLSAFPSLSHAELSFAKRRAESLAHADVILHIGPPKTATTHVQAGFRRLRHELAEKGYCYPVGEQHTQHSVGKAFREGKAGSDHDTAAVRACLASGKKVIFSTEKLSTVFSKAGFNAIRSLFAGRRVHVVAAYRESLTVSYSYYNQLGRGNSGTLLPFSQYVARYYDKLEAHMFHLCFANYAREFGAENMTVIDFNGVMAVHKDVTDVFLCDLLGLCGLTAIAEEGSNPSHDLLTNHLLAIVTRQGNTLQCDTTLTDEAYHSIVRGYASLDLSKLPVDDLDFEAMAELAVRVDDEIRRDFGQNMIYNNRSAAMAALNKFSVKEISDSRFHASPYWTRWLLGEVGRLEDKGFFKHCAKVVLPSDSKGKGNLRKHDDDDDDGDEEGEEDDDEDAEDDDE